jgi:hypothetical protein
MKRKLITTSAAALAVPGLMLSLGAASAGAATVRHAPHRAAAGSIELGSPLQYERFLAVTGGWRHGVVDYTNWTYAEPGSRVWAPVNAPQTLTFTYDGSQYVHTLNGGLNLTATSNHELVFSGTGYYDASPATTWTIEGKVTGDHFTAMIAYDGSTYTVAMKGTIENGVASGTAESSTGQALTFTLPGFQTVLSYSAPISSATVRGHRATFSFTIPSRVVGLAGIEVTVNVYDGRRLWRDTYAANGIQYPILAGSLEIPVR